MLIVFNQMISLFLLMLTGYLANRFGVIDKTFESKVSRFIVNISLPASILNAVTGSDMAHDQEMLPIFIAAASIFLVAHVVCHFIQKIICWNPTYELMLNYSNLGFMGIPIPIANARSGIVRSGLSPKISPSATPAKAECPIASEKNDMRKFTT